mmetsp:Transcript_33373/g.75394  ORF Transcript_33373/g.75394 Transcript_33373/m.75394 type:complete len:548 (+) Transcript_33373:158-1801(+)
MEASPELLTNARYSQDDARQGGQVSDAERKEKKRERKKARKERKERLSAASSLGGPESVDGGDSLDAIKKRHGFARPSVDDACSEDKDEVFTAPQGVAPQAAQSKDARLREELTCAVCHDVLFEPILLSCGHSFCRPCLREAFRTSEGSGAHRCLTCRRNLCGCSLSLPISVALWNTIKIVFPNEVAERRREQRGAAAERRRATAGENGGRHPFGYVETSECLADESAWEKLGRKGLGSTATHSIVLDAEDGTRYLSLACSLEAAPQAGESPIESPDCEEGKQPKPRKRVASLGDELTLSVYLLSMEEDEVEDGGFPLLLRDGSLMVGDDSGGDDAALICSWHNGPVQVRVASTGFAWSGTVECTHGRASLQVPFGDSPGDYRVSVTDATCGAVLLLRVPVAPLGGGRGWDNGGRHGGGASSVGEESQEEGLDEFESDGFIVMSDEESGDAADSNESDDGEPSPDASQDTCQVCQETTVGSSQPVLICESCEGEAHLGCSGLDQVPEDEWFCSICDGTSWQGKGRGDQEEDEEEEEEEEEEEVALDE